MTRLGILIVGTLAALLIGIGPASAQQITIDDASGNASSDGLDITSVTLSNNDRNVSARVRFASTSAGGDLIVSVDPRRARGLRMVSLYDPVGHTDDFVVSGAFTDKRLRREEIPCKGFRVYWSMDRPVARVTMPSRCLQGGDYGALRFGVLTEGGDSGGDSDSAPEDASGDVVATKWVPRG